MAVDKLVDSTQLDSDLTSVANAIRTKGGTSASLAFPAGFVSAINAISGGGGDEYKTGTVTPSERVKYITIDPGLSTIHGLLIVPTSATPLKSGGVTLVAILCAPNDFYKTIAIKSNSGGSSIGTPQAKTDAAAFTQSGTTLTVYATYTGTPSMNSGYFETVSYTWYAW